MAQNVIRKGILRYVRDNCEAGSQNPADGHPKKLLCDATVRGVQGRGPAIGWNAQKRSYKMHR